MTTHFHSQASRLRETEERLARREEQLQHQRSKVTAQERAIALERRRRHDLVVQLNLLSDELHELTQAQVGDANANMNGRVGGGSGGGVHGRYASPNRKQQRSQTPTQTPSPHKPPRAGTAAQTPSPHTSPALMRVRGGGGRGGGTGVGAFFSTDWSPARVAAVGSLERAKQVRHFPTDTSPTLWRQDRYVLNEVWDAELFCPVSTALFVLTLTLSSASFALALPRTLGMAMTVDVMPDNPMPKRHSLPNHNTTNNHYKTK